MLVGAARVVMAELAEVERPGGGRAGGAVGPGHRRRHRARSRRRRRRPRIREGVAPDRVISVSDPEMRHGRKSSARRFDGHKMDVITDEASELVLGVDVRAGNAADGEGALPLLDQVQSVPGG